MKRYNEYKDSRIEWIGKIPREWKVKRGNEALNFVNGYPFDSTLFTLERANAFPLVRIRDLSADNLNTFYKGEIIENAIVDNGDILIGMDGDFNIVKWNKGKALLNQRVCKISGNGGFSTSYLYYTLPFYLQIINDLTYYTTVKHLSNRDLKEQLFVCPSLEEQTQIAQYLDHKTSQIDKLITNKEKLIELLNEERTAVINQAVTKGLNPEAPMKDSGIEWLGEVPEHWELKKIKHIAIVNPVKPIGFERRNEQQVVFLPMEKVSESGKIMQDVRKAVSEVDSGFTYFRRGDVIIAKITPCFENGKGALLDTLASDFGFGSTEFHVIRATERITKEFIYYITKSARFMVLGEAFMIGSAGQKRVSTNFMKDFKIGLPPIEEQNEIVSLIKSTHNAIDITVARIQQEIQLLKEYKTALISEVVTGKVDVRGEVIAQSTELVP